MRKKFGNISLYYEEIGSGKPIVILHGWSLDHVFMKGALEPLFVEREGWRRIYVDLPGMGQSDAPDWLKTQDQMLDVVMEFINTVVPNERFCVAGVPWVRNSPLACSSEVSSCFEYQGTGWCGVTAVRIKPMAKASKPT